tara:strand:+ start:112 stop:393 length:282 start_codon:yes stop_codon:yes gene_type:complete
MIQITLGSYTIVMNYLFKRSNRNTYYYKRRVPKDLQAHYPKPFIEISLRQSDQTVMEWAAACVAQSGKGGATGGDIGMVDAPVMARAILGRSR